MEIKINNTLVKLVQSDIIVQEVDTIVISANASLIMGRGLEGQIKLHGGDIIEMEAMVKVKKKGKVLLGDVIETTAGSLKTKYIFHAIIRESVSSEIKKETIESATKNSLLKAEEFGIKTMAFPAFGTAQAKFPYDNCAELMLTQVIKHVKAPTNLEVIIFSLFNENCFQHFAKKMNVLTLKFDIP